MEKRERTEQEASRKGDERCPPDHLGVDDVGSLEEDAMY